VASLGRTGGLGTLRDAARVGRGDGAGTGSVGTGGSTLRAAAGGCWLGCVVLWRMSMRSLSAWAWLSVWGQGGVGGRIVEGMDNVHNA